MKKLSFFLMAMLMSVMSFAAEVSVTISKYADDHNWSNGVQYKTVEIDDVVSITAKGTSNTGKYYTSGEQWRMYQTESPKITVTAKDGYLLKSATFTYASKNTGILKDASNKQVTSGSLYTFNSDVASYTFGVGNTGTATNGQVNFTIITVVYELSSSVDPDATTYTVTALVNDQTMGTVTGAGEYIEGTTATLTANPNSGYEFVKWSNESTDNPLKITVTEDATYTAIFQEKTPITCSQIKDLAIGDAFVLGEFTVTYVNGSYTYIKDATGASLIYASNYGLKAGDVVTGLAGTRANFNGLVQINPTVTKAQLTITAGTAPQPEVATANPTQADMNKYVKYEQVTFDATAFSSKKINATLAGQTTKFAVYDQWSFNKTFVKGGTYEFIGAVSYYNAVQVNFISATKVSLTISATATDGKVTGTGEYMEGDEATLIATANEGYEFVNWTEGETVVSTEANYSFEVLADRNLVANFQEAAPTYDFEVVAKDLYSASNEVMTQFEGSNSLNPDMTISVTLFASEYGTYTSAGAEEDEFNALYAGSQILGELTYSYSDELKSDLVVIIGTITDEEETSTIKVTMYEEYLEPTDVVVLNNLQKNVQKMGWMSNLMLFNAANDTIITISGCDGTYGKYSAWGTFGADELEGKGEWKNDGENDVFVGVLYNADKTKVFQVTATTPAEKIKEYTYELADVSFTLSEVSNTLIIEAYAEEPEPVQVYLELAGWTPEQTIYAVGEMYGSIANMDNTEGADVANLTYEVESYLEGKELTITAKVEDAAGNTYLLMLTGEYDSTTTALDNLNTTVAPVKAIINGQLIIINNGVQFNAQGQVIK